MKIPCSPGCSGHVSHPCEICGQQWGKSETELKQALFVEKKCPDCNGGKFFEGPHGVLSVNIKCAGCGSRFNVCPPLFAERI